MSGHTDNRVRIDQYIGEYPDARLDEVFPISLKGKREVLSVYRLPIDMLFYNIKNGRFAAEYAELVKNEGGYLEPEKIEDAKRIRQLLLELDKNETKRTYNDIKIRGQWNCGIITEDGYLIDGNRRLSIISQLYEDTGAEEWKYIKVARLDRPISSEDLWALEAGIQLGKDQIIRYGPVNELLKIREGMEAGLSPKSIISALYGYEKEEEITTKLVILGLIDQYLIFMGIPEKYSKVKDRVEHFINLQKIIKECNDRDFNPEKIVKITHTVFELIKENTPHLEIRKIRNMIEKGLDGAILEIEEAGSVLKPLQTSNANNGKEGSEEVDMSKSNAVLSPTQTHFINAKDILDVSNNEGKEMILLLRAEKNLRPLLDYQGDELSTSEARDTLKKISNYVNELSKKYGR